MNLDPSPPAIGDFQDLRVAVIGSATGIGRAVAEAFVAVGSRVSMADIDPSVHTVARSIGAVSSHVGDIGTLDQPARLVTEAAQALSGLDCLINVAGIQIVGSIAETKPEDWDRLMAVNLRGPYLTCQAALLWLEQSSRGAVVNTSSIAAKRGGAGGAAYAASKGGLQTDCLINAFGCAESAVCGSSRRSQLALSSGFPAWELF